MMRKMLLWVGYSLPFSAKSHSSECQSRPTFRQREKEKSLLCVCSWAAYSINCLCVLESEVLKVWKSPFFCSSDWSHLSNGYKVELLVGDNTVPPNLIARVFHRQWEWDWLKMSSSYPHLFSFQMVSNQPHSFKKEAATINKRWEFWLKN